MTADELDRQIADTMKNGFDDSFVGFCAKTFDSYRYPPENLPAARMHACYLRLAMEALINGATKAEVLSIRDSGRIKSADPELLCLYLAGECYRAALHDEGNFCELFIGRWCRALAG